MLKYREDKQSKSNDKPLHVTIAIYSASKLIWRKKTKQNTMKNMQHKVG